MKTVYAIAESNNNRVLKFIAEKDWTELLDGKSKTIYAVVKSGSKVLKCFTEKEWAEQYIECLKSQRTSYKRVIDSLLSVYYVVIPLTLCEKGRQ